MKITPKFVNHFLLHSVIVITLLIRFTATAGNSTNRSAFYSGARAHSFQASTIEGKTVNFPGDYKGKVVLLDFWATWCGLCREEITKLVATYGQYHDKGFEVLGVSMDRPNHGKQLVQFLKDNNMTWPQIYDGGYGKARIAVEYTVHAIPCTLLVDGDTGIIIANDHDALGSRLDRNVKRALAAKGKP